MFLKCWRNTTGNRSSNNNDKIHETEAFLPELKTESFLYKDKQPALLASYCVAVLAPSGASEAEFSPALLFCRAALTTASGPACLPSYLPTILGLLRTLYLSIFSFYALI